MDRTPFRYVATLTTSEGQTTEEDFVCHWSPEREGVLELVAESAAAMMNARLVRGGSEVRAAGIAARLA